MTDGMTAYYDRHRFGHKHYEKECVYCQREKKEKEHKIKRVRELDKDDVLYDLFKKINEIVDWVNEHDQWGER